MKKTIAILTLAAGSASGQINWGTLLDTQGERLADAQSGNQIFDISTDGSGCFLEVSWGVTGNGTWNVGPNSNATIGNTSNAGVGGNTITFTLLNAIADWNITSQPTNTAAIGELGALFSDAAITATAVSGLTTLAGSGSTIVTYGSPTQSDNGQFTASIAGASTFTYAYDNSTRAEGGTSGDGFTIGIDASSLIHVPEPSTALLTALAALGFVAHRRRA